MRYYESGFVFVFFVATTLLMFRKELNIMKLV